MQLICIRYLVEVGETKLRRIRQNQKIANRSLIYAQGTNLLYFNIKELTMNQ